MKMEKKTRARSRARQEKFAVVQGEPGKLMEQMGAAFASWAREGLSREPFLLVGLSGGRSLEELFEKARGRLPKALWRRILFFPVDERVVAPSNAENNARLLRTRTLRALVSRGELKAANVLALDTGQMMNGKNAARELAAYSRLLATLRPDGADLLVLGIGEDGHVASLFPKSKELKAKGRQWLLVKNAPKPPPVRATMAPDDIRRAKELWLVARGEEKRRALEKLLDAKGTAARCPARLARENPNGAILWTDLN